MHDQSAIRAALDIGATAGTQERTIDITTTGAKSGDPRRIEIWFPQIGDRWYNLESNPRFTFHLKNGVKADLGATARLITDPQERRDVFQQILDGLNDPSITLPVEFPPLEDWVTFSPAIEVTFDDFAS
jgi:hypothetical protein